MKNIPRANSDFSRSVDTIGWALFFVWVGVALLSNMSWTGALGGAAAIILGVQAALYFQGERVDLFMTAVALVLIVAIVTDLSGSTWSLFPALLIIIGIAMLANTLRALGGR